MPRQGRNSGGGWPFQVEGLHNVTQELQPVSKKEETTSFFMKLESQLFVIEFVVLHRMLTRAPLWARDHLSRPLLFKLSQSSLLLSLLTSPPLKELLQVL